MALTNKQSGVLTGMLIGLVIGLILLFIGIFLNPFNFQESLSITDCLIVTAKTAIFPTLFLVIAIGRIAGHRFFTPEDIDGSGLTMGTDKVKILQSLLQNTLEQLTLVIPIYFIWAIIMPASWLSVVVFSGCEFCIGRILFFIGYNKGAAARSIGFSLTFYSTLLMLVCIVLKVIYVI